MFSSPFFPLALAYATATSSNRGKKSTKRDALYHRPNFTKARRSHIKMRRALSKAGRRASR